MSYPNDPMDRNRPHYTHYLLPTHSASQSVLYICFVYDEDDTSLHNRATLSFLVSAFVLRVPAYGLATIGDQLRSDYLLHDLFVMTFLRLSLNGWVDAQSSIGRNRSLR